MTDEEFIKSQSAKADKVATAGKDENAGVLPALNALFTKAASTATGGATDYLDMLVRRQKGENIGSVDDVRKGYDKLYEAHLGMATTGALGGSALQWIPAARAVSAVAKLPALGSAGRAVATAMEAPGIVGGLKSGAITGGALGVASEAGRQADRLGSPESAAQDFSPIGSLGRIAVDTGLGAAGGGVGGAIGNMTKAGQIGKLADRPIGEQTLQHLDRAVRRDAPRVGLGDTIEKGKLSASEAMRAVADPAAKAELGPIASQLEGLTQRASKGMTDGVLPQELTQAEGRLTTAGPRSFDSQSGAAKRDLRNATTAVDLKNPQLLSPTAEAIVNNSPSLMAARDAAVTAARNSSRAGGMTLAEAAKANPEQAIGLLRKVLDNSVNVRDQNTARRALIDTTSRLSSGKNAGAPTPGGGDFKNYFDAINSMEPYTRFAGALGRQHATPPIEPTSGSLVGSLKGGIPTLLKDLVLTGRNALEGGAMTRAGVGNVVDDVMRTSRQVGRRSTAQNVTDPTLNTLLHFIQKNALAD